MIVTTNGRYLLAPAVSGINSSKYVVYVSGTYGGAAVRLQVQDELGNWIDLEDGLLLVNTQQIVSAGTGAKTSVVVTSASGTTEIAITARVVQ